MSNLGFACNHDPGEMDAFIFEEAVCPICLQQRVKELERMVESVLPILEKYAGLSAVDDFIEHWPPEDKP